MKLSAKICLALGGVIFAVGAYLSVVALRGDYIWTHSVSYRPMPVS